MGIADLVAKKQREQEEIKKKKSERESLTDTASRLLEGKLTGLDRAVGEATFGAYPAVADRVNAAAHYAGNRLAGTNEEMGFNDFLGQIQQSRRDAQARHPRENIMGAVAGGSMGGLAAAGAFNKAADAGKAAAATAPGYVSGLLRAPAALTQGVTHMAKLGRPAVAALGGATQGYSSALGFGDENPENQALAGAVGAGGFQFGAEALSSLARSSLGKRALTTIGGPFKEFTNREGTSDAYESIFSPGKQRSDMHGPAQLMNKSENLPKGQTPGLDYNTLMDKANTARPDQLGIDLFPARRNLRPLNAYASSEATLGYTNKLETVAEQRIAQAEEKSGELIFKYFKPSGSKASTLAELGSERLRGKELYDEMYNSRHATKMIAGKQTIKDDVLSLQKKEHGTTERLAVKKVLREIDTIHPDSKMFTGRDLISLKKSIDRMITDKNPNKSVDAHARAILIDAKKRVAERLQKIPGYKEATGIYSDAYNEKDAFETGMTMLKGNKFDPSEVSAYVDTLDGAEKALFREGAAIELQSMTANQGMGVIRKMMKNPHNPTAAKVKAIFGDVDFDQFIKDSEELIRELAVAENSIAALNKTAGGDPGHMQAKGLTNTLDATVAAIQAGARGPLSTQALIPARRVLRNPDYVQARAVMDLFQAQGPDEIPNTLMDLKDAVTQRAGPRTMMPGALGQGISTILDEENR